MTDSPDDTSPPIDELDRVAFDAVVRSAPRFGRFIGTGVAVGVVLGFILGFALPNSTNVGRGVVGMLLALGFGMVGAIVTGAIVTRVDRTRSAPVGPMPWDVDLDPVQTFTPSPTADGGGADGGAKRAAPTPLANEGDRSRADGRDLSA